MQADHGLSGGITGRRPFQYVMKRTGALVHLLAMTVQKTLFLARQLRSHCSSFRTNVFSVCIHFFVCWVMVVCGLNKQFGADTFASVVVVGGGTFRGSMPVEC